MEKRYDRTTVPEKLLCEFAEYPLMIDVTNPRFSWKLPATGEVGERGLRQTACEIEVFRKSGDMLDPMWMSGRVEYQEPFGMCYGGDQLESFSVYTWRVRIWTATEKDNGKERRSEYSDWAFFETAALSESDFSALWITHPHPEAYLEGAWESGTPHKKSDRERSAHYMAAYCSFLSKIEDYRKIVRARALVCGLGLFRFYVNGKIAGDDILSPAQTDFRRRALYNVYDITKDLQCGAEALLTLVLGNGRHIALYGFGKPKGYVQVWIDLDDGQRLQIVSDASWLIQDGPVR
jgi:alpha-L-rhamnosidase